MSDDAFDTARRELLHSRDSTADLCRPFLSVVPTTGVALAVLASRVGPSTICSTDDLSSRLDEMQFDLGQGPCWESMANRAPVLHPDLRSEADTPWPAFAEAVSREPIASIFAFPLSVGGVDIGAVDLYSSTAQQLSDNQITRVSVLAELASWQVLRRLLNDSHDDSESGSRYSRHEVHQATGMVLVQLDIAADDAMLLLRAHAFSSAKTVREIANDVVERRLVFSTDAPETRGRDGDADA
ncbi:GAF and ANTAR domain-containing protein [Lacisediminihabitans changchengi]|uniref:GAF and ANTAR domain-containing protein n=1 Tax=Lacisediminihabitans changchengi TaxID=2787634 RepID=A0A934W411_9MICO|nr:GAF and ANTAR domain-containing protein [Lacisediminihabitans changchengi]MBK4347025.1 GAF and ANTAR domain-containing protein [Lacisediminihabitans changchengi]MBK4347852.1 GAF and ANTAR domain-containing protein [Lacisediminihabitans changchengi]